MLRVIVMTVCLLFVVTTEAAEIYQFESAKVESDYNKLINELRCLVCQNQNLAGSDAELAQDLRRQTYEMLSAGKSPDQVVDYMVARYGDFVMYRPQFKTNTYLLWLGPFLLLLLVFWQVTKRVKAVSVEKIASDDAMQRAKQLLNNNGTD